MSYILLRQCFQIINAVCPLWGLKLTPGTVFYPTALKGCRGIVFTHGVQTGGRREIVFPGCISETLRCRKFIRGRDIGWGV